MEHSAYIPGVCNIGQAEIAMRKRTGWIGLALTVLLWATLTFLGTSAIWFSLLCVPSAISAVGFIQAKMHFCAGFGMKGLFNFGPEVGKTDTAMQASFRAQDRTKAIQILGYSALVGVVVAIASCYLRNISS